MRVQKLVLSVLAVLMMSGCSNTYHGAKYNVKDMFHWMHGDPSYMEKRWGHVPTGYYGHHKRAPLLKPAPDAAVAWVEVGNYGAPIPQEQGPVTVYPIDGEAPIAMADPVYTDYGQLMQQLWFAHGSSAISAADKAQLKNLAQSVKSNENAVAMTVVGHASTRVDGVMDDVRRKEINFEMAQKRANAVTTVLRNAGVTPGWIEAVSRGEEYATGNEQNDRRADVFVRQ